jgi:lipopolysaccharide export system ATP-binding protein
MDQPMDDVVVLESKSLKKSFKNRTVVKDATLNIHTGEVVGLLGPNGAGKTTIFYMMVGLLWPDRGDIFINHERITDLPIYLRARKGIGYLPQEASIFRKMTVEENLHAILETLDLTARERSDRAESLLREFNVLHLARQKANTLSGGERRRVEIARALVTSPLFLLLDEPFAGIDPIAVGDIQKIISQLKERGIGVLITDHNVQETLDITDRAYLINEGEIFESGTPHEIANSSKARTVYLGERFRWQP